MSTAAAAASTGKRTVEAAIGELGRLEPIAWRAESGRPAVCKLNNLRRNKVEHGAADQLRQHRGLVADQALALGDAAEAPRLRISQVPGGHPPTGDPT